MKKGIRKILTFENNYYVKLHLKIYYRENKTDRGPYNFEKNQVPLG